MYGQQRCAWRASEATKPTQTNETFDYRNGVFTIPVVVHVVAQNAQEDLSDAQISSQIEVLNRDFRRNNIEIPDIHPLFNGQAADVELEFCLVATTRTTTSVAGIYNQFSNGKRRVCHTSEGGHDAVAPNQYLNIWISGRSDNALGSATAPGEASAGEDGVFIAPAYFGTLGTAQPPYNLGRTTTHEIGHYLGLKHLWGPGLENDNSCSGDDDIADTPRQFSSYQHTCPSIPLNTCGSPDMFMNFMNYTDDACMALFTAGQKEKMRNCLTQQRAGLLNSSCLPLSDGGLAIPQASLSLFPVPASERVKIEGPVKDVFEFAIFDLHGRFIRNGQIEKASGSELDVSSLPNGLYIINIRDEHRLYIKKLIIAR
jgi:hypothetical protein